MADRKPPTPEREVMTRFARNCIEHIRYRDRCTTADIARAINMRPNTLYSYLSMRQLPVREIVRLAELAGVDLSTLDPAKLTLIRDRAAAEVTDG